MVDCSRWIAQNARWIGCGETWAWVIGGGVPRSGSCRPCSSVARHVTLSVWSNADVFRLPLTVTGPVLQTARNWNTNACPDLGVTWQWSILRDKPSTNRLVLLRTRTRISKVTEDNYLQLLMNHLIVCHCRQGPEFPCIMGNTCSSVSS